MAKKNMKKYLPKTGSAAAVALAMSAVISLQANATENVEPPVVDEAPVVVAEAPAPAAEAPAPAPAAEAPAPVVEAPPAAPAEEAPVVSVEPTAYNESVAESNTETVESNNDVVEENNETVENNDAAIDSNETVSGGELTDPGLTAPDASEIPEAPNSDAPTGEYNEAVDDYNDAVEDYNDAAYDYNKEAEDYNEAAGAYEDQAQKDYEQAVKDYESEKTTHDADKQEYDDQKKAWDDYDQAWKEHQEKVKAQEGLDAEALENYDKDYNQQVTDYEKELETHNQQAAEHEIYNEVDGYNTTIKTENGNIEQANEDLREAVDADTIDSLDELAEGSINENVQVDATVLETLGTHETLAGVQSELEAWAARLDANVPPLDSLGSEEYAAYLADVKAYNDAVFAHNANVAAYNTAVATYNEKVAEYNAAQKPDTSTSTEGEYSQGTADWGNIDIEDHTAGHLDVKFDAAVSMNKVEENGSTNYEVDVTNYTVDGVYTNSENTGDYGLNYLNSSTGTFTTQDLDKQNFEFRAEGEGGGFGGGHNWWNQNQSQGVKINPMTGEVSFYMTVTDAEGNVQGLNVNLDASSTYADGTYYKPASADGDRLQYYVDSENKPLKKVEINGEYYYDISGKSVFVISTLACNGAKYDEDNKKVNPDGLDLVLNLQTVIKISQEDSAKKLTYLDFEMGKTAQAVDPGDPGKWTKTPPTYDPPGPTKLEFNYEEPKFDRPTKDPGEWTKEAPSEPGKMVRLEYVEYLDYLDKKATKIEFEIPEPEPPAPVAHLDFGDDFGGDFGGFDEWDNIDNDGLMNIPDEAVPLAKAPETGDFSPFWAAISSLSLGGVFFLNRKRKEEV